MDDIAKQQYLETLLRGMAAAIDETINEKLGNLGFALVVFEFNKLDLGHYVSNARRDDMIKALRELADRLEKNQTIPPGHEVVQ